MVSREAGGGKSGAASQAGFRRPSSSQQSQRRVGASTPRQPTPTLSPRPASQPTSQARDDDQPSQSDLSGEETSKLVAEVMRHMLFKNHQQPSVPVRREELVGLITKTYKQRHLPGDIISQAQRKLRTIFGFAMYEYVRIKSAKAAKSSKSAKESSQVETKEYVLTSLLSKSELRKHVETPGMAAVHSLAVLVVGIIKFSGGEKVPEETLMQNLQRMGIREEHPVLGSLSTALDLLAKQRYIQKDKSTSDNYDGFVYDLAERALDEGFERRLEELTSKIVTRDNATEKFYER